MSEPYVFISYARQDRSFVEQLVERLRVTGVRTWTDIDDISPGADWEVAINQGVVAATALIYVASEHSASSRWMDAEVLAFQQSRRKIIPVVIDDAGPANLSPTLQRLQWIDFRGGFEPGLARLLSGIAELRGDAPQAPAVPRSKGYVFISYADEDAAFVSELKGFLKKQGYGYWDYRESTRNYQSDYTLELEEVIRNARGTLSVVSPDWKRSPTAFQELHFSREVNTPVFLLKVRDPGPTLAISGMTYIDFIGTRTSGFTQLDGEMRRKGL